jgi:hypothetical protein
VADDNAGFNAVGVVRRGMQCHYCDRDADIAVEKDGVKVGVCKEHFREQMEDLADSEWLEDVEKDLDIDRTE